jgi:genome maintenance exonuclease 1
MIAFNSLGLGQQHVFNHCPVSLPYKNLGDASTHAHRIYVTPDGNHYPSITTVLSASISDSIKNWRNAVGETEANRVTHHACTRGTALHEIAERYLNNDENYIGTNPMPHVVCSFKGVKEILDKNVKDICCQEAALYSDHLKVAGRVDCIATFNGRRSVIDFKTSKRHKSREEILNYFAQASAYAIMFEERTKIAIPQIVIIMAVDGIKDACVFIEKRDDHVIYLKQAIKAYTVINS